MQIREKLPLTLEQLQKLQQFGGAASMGTMGMPQRQAMEPAQTSTAAAGFPDRSAPGGLSGALGDLSQPEQAELQSKVRRCGVKFSKKRSWTFTGAD